MKEYNIGFLMEIAHFILSIVVIILSVYAFILRGEYRLVFFTVFFLTSVILAMMGIRKLKYIEKKTKLGYVYIAGSVIMLGLSIVSIIKM